MSLGDAVGAFVEADDVEVWIPNHRVKSPRDLIERIRSEVNRLTPLVEHLHSGRPALYSSEAGAVAVELILLLNELGDVLGYDLLGQLEDQYAAAIAAASALAPDAAND
ncbi:MAG: hypothetical protein JWO74_2310 [Solirubrobacterales bacterium]|nr:hypothetical protein [Solirubrobacterales bacterium]